MYASKKIFNTNYKLVKIYKIALNKIFIKNFKFNLIN